MSHTERFAVEIWPGTAYPLGATYDGSGVNFAVFSEVAQAVELCLVDEAPDGTLTEQRIAMPEVDGFVWHCYLPGLQPGQRYEWKLNVDGVVNDDWRLPFNCQAPPVPPGL